MDTQSKHDILLESGTNELEILVFTLEQQRYGVNVAKVREVLNPVRATALPESHEAIVGVFTLREHVTPLIDLRRCLHKAISDNEADGKIIIMEFNDARVGFLVDTVEQIYRVSWKDVTAIPDLEGVREAPITSVAHINDNMVLMLDFEKLVFDIGGVDVFEQRAKNVKENVVRGEQKLLLAEDSHLMRKLIHGNLLKAGYSEVTVCHDGQEAWEHLQKQVAVDGNVGVDLVITDIEMPRMDGLYLTRQIKQHPQLKCLPVIIFSSMVSTDNEKKCQAVGADAQITKPQLDKLVDLIDGLICNNSQTSATCEPATA